jgi:hypothetical protein
MNIGLIYFKRENNEFKFLLGKKNLKTLNLNNNLYSDLGGHFSEDSLDKVKEIFNDHTFNLLEFKDDEKDYFFKNDKYNYKLYFFENDISDSVLETVNKVRSNINKSSELDVKWFSLDEIIESKDLFEKDFFNTFLKAVKKYKNNFIKV